MVIGPYIATPPWDGHRFDVVWAIDVLRGHPAPQPVVQVPPFPSLRLDSAEKRASGPTLRPSLSFPADCKDVA